MTLRVQQPRLIRESAWLHFSCSVLAVLLVLISASRVQAQEVSRVLILHGVGQVEEWEHGFDRALIVALNTDLDHHIDLSPQYLGLDLANDFEDRPRLKSHIEALIRQREIDLIIAVLPAAVEFLSELHVAADISRVLVLPDSNWLKNAELPANVGIIESAWREAMTSTIEQILVLRPATETIEVFVGSGVTGQVYRTYFDELANGFTDSVNFNVQQGIAPRQLLEYSANLSDSTSIFNLPYERYGQQQASTPTDFFTRLIETASVPIFSLVDTDLDLGGLGGHMTNLQAYADSTVDMVQSLLRGETIQSPSRAASASTIYNWEEVQRWDLPLQRLTTPYQLVNQPISIWQQYPLLIAIISNLMLLMFGLLFFQAMMLKRSKTAQASIAVSELQARENESKYKLLASTSMDVIWKLDAKSGILTYCSPSIERLSGFTASEFQKMPLQEMMTPESVKICKEVFYRSDPRPQVFEIEHYTRSGPTVWCEIAAQPSDSKDGGDGEWVGITRDISRRKQSEADQQVLEKQIQQTQKFESLGTLAGGIAHDFNNILGVVIGITDLLKTEFTDNKAASKLLKKLMSASEKARALVQQILTFSRQSAGRKEVIELNSLVEDCLAIMEAGIPKKVILRKKIASSPLYIEADPSHIAQVIINLVTNSFEAVDGENGKIIMSLAQHHFDEETKFAFSNMAVGDYAWLRIEDNGVGIAPDQLDKVFDPFYTNKALGNGMGLAIVHGIVMDHGGTIDIESRRGEGTVINIYFPLTEIAQTKPVNEQLVINPATALRIIVVDDQKELLDVFSIMLKHLGHECMSCSDPRDALELIKKEHENLDLVITDYSMPEMSGLEVGAFCAQHYPSLPIILSTGYGDRINDSITQEHGISMVLKKPFRLNQLDKVLRQVCTSRPVEKLSVGTKRR